MNDCRCILEGLQCIHDAGCGHGDIRWPNIVHIAGSQFILIDLEDAVVLSEAVTEPYLRAWNEGAALQEGKYTIFSDLYQVGRMIPTGDVEEDADRCNFKEKLVNMELSISQALAHPWMQQAQR
jgi:hypothetical protein